jgi:hypothetical protein
MKNTFEFIGQNGGNGTVEQLTGCFRPTGGHKIVKANNELTEREKFEYYQQQADRIREAQEFFAKHGIENYNER